MGQDNAEKQDNAVRDGAFANQIARGYPFLRFEKSLERDFRRGFDQENLNRARMGVQFGIFLIGLDIVLNAMLIPQGEIWTKNKLMIAAILVPLLLLSVWSLQKFSDRVRVSLVTLPIVLVATLALTFFRINPETPSASLPLEAFFLLLLFNFVLAGLTFLQSCVGAVIIVGGYVVSNYVLAVSELVWSFDLFFLISVTMMGCISVYMTERQARNNYLSGGVLSELSERDELTQLYNRRVFNRNLGNLIRLGRREGRPVMLLLLDVDHFKKYNDRYGHAAGDVCLRKVADALSMAAKRPLDVVARYGGEEFAVILYGARTGSVKLLADTVRQNVESLQIPHEGSEHRVVTVSGGGVVAFVDENSDEVGLIEAADKALYRSKAEGRNRVTLLQLGDMSKARELASKMESQSAANKLENDPLLETNAAQKKSRVKRAVDAALKDKAG